MKYLITLIIVLNGIVSLANNPSNNSEYDVYYESLKLHIQYLKTLHIELDTIFVREMEYLGDYTGIVEGVFIKMVDNSFVHNSTRKKNKLSLTVVNAIKFENQKATIYVVDFNVSRKKEEYNMINNGNSKIELTYNCNQNKYEYKITNR